ncbi:MAG: 2-oxo-hept-4-ene-1,7-dioate hydratase [Acidimicrobiales bacterium]
MAGPTTDSELAQRNSSPLADADVEAEAVLLDEAESTATQIRQTTSVYPAMTIDDAYRVQAAWLEQKLRRGERLVGHKIGLTSRAMQRSMNITTPDSGFLTERMVFAPNSTLDARRFCDPKLEVELAFVLATDLAGAALTVDDVLDATDRVVPAIELIAARSYRVDPETARTRTVVDTIADNAADAGIVCGGSPVGPRDVDLRWVGALAYRNGSLEETGLAAGVLDHPALGIAWLAKRYHEQGLTLEAGQTILAGSFTRPVDIAPGDNFRFDYGPLGSFELSFEETP